MRTQSACENVIFSANSGQTKPKKHLMLGMTMKSFTGSRKVIEILNKLDPFVSYHTVEEIETEITFEANKEGALSPHGMICNLLLGTGFAWYNFEGFVTTMTGTDTLHDTFSVAYRARFKDDIDVTNESTTENIVIKQLVAFNISFISSYKENKRNQSYEFTRLNIKPCCKRPKLQSSDLLPKTDKRRKEHENQEKG